MTTTGAPVTTALDELGVVLHGGLLLTGADAVEGYRRDEAHLVEPGVPLAVLLATDTAEVGAALAWATRHDVPVVPRGAGTGLAGGASAVDGCLVLSLLRMDRVLEVDADNQLVVVQPGVITADVDRAAAEVGLMYPPDPSSFEISTIGGNLATNAGGLRCVKYGVTRDSVLGLEVVLADGTVVQTGRRTVKGVAGYDLTGLFVGSEGTLGVITAATLRLRPRPALPPVTVVAEFGSLAEAGRAVADVARAGLAPSMMELLDRTTLRAIEDWKSMGLDADVAAMLVAQADGDGADRCAAALLAVFEAAGATFAAVSSDETEAAELVAVRRLAYPALERLGRCLVEDVGVPRSRLPEMIERIEDVAARTGLTIATVAHAGDGNLHPTFVFPPGDVPPVVWSAADEVFRAALALGGTLTGEHGVGVLKAQWLAQELGPGATDLHHRIKAAIDPAGILNPGKALPV